ncbi:hypothetical protein [Planktothricoides sp. SR001]|uniref:hypothetical protein n=1 Tax=Planktothricoides sp. SR001 TaxID=1705388 RepID=UPI0012E22BE3|nr:hypothetical protein [Planktothricoides sp. SR001]
MSQSEDYAQKPGFSNPHGIFFADVSIAILRLNAIGVMVFLTDEDYWARFGLYIVGVNGH